MKNEQNRVAAQIREMLEARIARLCRIERSEVPVLSLAEITSLLFGLIGHTNFLGGFYETTSAIRTLVGDDSFLQRPKRSQEPVQSGTIH